MPLRSEGFREFERLGRELFGPNSDVLADRPWLIVSPHPDDESIGASWVLARAPLCAVLHVTEGAPEDPRLWPRGFDGNRAQYAALRRNEARAALACADIAPERILQLGFDDQGLIDQLPACVTALKAIIQLLSPPVIVTCPYEGGHPDHDATAFAVRAALALLKKSGDTPPLLVEMTAYHRWGEGLRMGEFLPGERPACVRRLSAADRARKRAMFACYGSQSQVLAPFDVDQERFRVASRVNFSEPPHEGGLYWESLGWPLTGPDFRSHVRDALRALHLPPQDTY